MPFQVDDVLRRVKLMEERMLGKGTPLGSSSDLELPVMDPNSRISDSDDGDDDKAHLDAGDVSWELAENLDDIEMPDLGIDQDLDNDNAVFRAIDNEKEADTEVDLDLKPVNLDDFFKSKTPELPKRVYSAGIQSESLQSESGLQMPKFPQVSGDEKPLISFDTP